MKVAKGLVVSLDYSLHLGDGQVIDASEPGSPLAYIHGEGQIVPGLEAALEGLETGAARDVVVAAPDGYGEHDARGLQEVPIGTFPPQLQPHVGQHLTAEGPDGESISFVVHEVRPESVVIDLNHPLAGKALHFSVKVMEVREATDEERSHGHVHGPGGAH